jgi:predicted butyrate kinase (DUF1464 family)
MDCRCCGRTPAVRPDDQQRQGVAGFSAVVRGFRACGLPIIFLPGVIHLPSVPAQRKFNRIDLGTPDKLCVAALALALHSAQSCCVVELGTAFTACMVLQEGRIVDALGGTCGPVGWGSAGAWDGEAAYLLSPLGKRDLFQGGVTALSDAQVGRAWLRESLVKSVAGLQAVTHFSQLILSGRLLESESELADLIEDDLARLAPVCRLKSLPGAWVKHAAQGAALVADGLAGGKYTAVVDQLQLQQTSGSVLDWLCHPRAGAVRASFGF